MSFGKTEIFLSDVKTWRKDLKEVPPITTLEELLEWTRNQLMHNVAPFLDSGIRAIDDEIAEHSEALADHDAAIEELIGQTEDFLQPEMAQDLTATLLLGLFIVETIEAEGLVLADDLLNKKLHDGMKLYKQNSNILFEQIDSITRESDDEDDSTDNGDSDGDSGETSGGLHGESGSGEEPDAGGSGVAGAIPIDPGTGGGGGVGGGDPRPPGVPLATGSSPDVTTTPDTDSSEGA